MMIVSCSFTSGALVLLLTAVCVAGDNSLTELFERMDALEERDAVQQELITELTKRDTEQEKLISDLRNELNNQKKEIKKLNQSVSARDRQIWKLLRTRRQTTGRSVKDIETSKDSEKGHPNGGQSFARGRRTENEVAVAFSAGLSKVVPHPGINQNIVFDHVEINLGNGYNPHHGIFVAPVSGTYVLFTTIYASHNYNHDIIFCHFVVNGVAKSSLYVESNTGSSDTGSQMVITQLDQGDDVAVQLISGVAGIYSDSTNLFSTFSGFLLQTNYSQPGNIIG